MSRVDFNREDREWFHRVCMTASGSIPDDRVDDEEEEPRPPVEQTTDPLEAALGMYPINVEGGMDVELTKLIMDKMCQCAHTGRRASMCTGFCKQLDLPRAPNSKAESIPPETKYVMSRLVLATLGSHQVN